MKRPLCPKKPKKLCIHSDIRIDNYYWLKQKNSREVIEYLQKENRYTNFIMKDTGNLQKQLFKEMVGRIKETDISVPVKKGEFFYYYRTEKGLNYPIYCRKKGKKGKEEILLDINPFAKQNPFLSLGIFAVSPDHNLFAYSLDTKGSESFTIYFKNLKTGSIFPETIKNTFYFGEFANDNRTFFYTVLDDAFRSFRVYKHKLGESVEKDELVYEESDRAFDISLSKSKDENYIFITSRSMTTSEVRFLDANNPQDKPRLFKKRKHKVEYYLFSWENYFLILTNENAINFKVLKVEKDKFNAPEHFQELIKHDENIYIEYLHVFKNHLAINERRNGLRLIRIFDMKKNSDHIIKFEEEDYTAYISKNLEYNSEILRIVYTSLKTPQSTYDYNMKNKKLTLLKQKEVPAGYNPDDYITTRIFATARDGTKVPVSLLYKKDMAKFPNPLYLEGYGSYGDCFDPEFDSNIFSLVDRGFIYAIAHIRGGGEFGREWYENGKLLKKKNTFHDFIACAKELITKNYTSSDKLVIKGASAGGLLMGAVTNEAPELFKAVIAKVPFVDVLTTMLDDSLPLTVTEWEEWGNPRKEEYYFYIKSYSPYDNVRPISYPNMLITAGLNDPRVQYWEPVKWTAKLRELNTSDNLILLKIDMDKGHMGSKGRYDYLKDIAFEYAFILKVFKTI